ncbi:cardiolipin synthase [Listeria grandensis]|uniref:Cardiolipin synthase n=1 Tax=Listeria grandensis TaxID=1494963 RepID=A0A7X0Y5A1_9LIST|nr:cardiolipin synthase [Listeria grandensis]MBC1475189.1 cardiolipin synthase [Listeria grandensis]MBC1937078.1 cardiolipin synthase [Listeria grandensis]
MQKLIQLIVILVLFAFVGWFLFTWSGFILTIATISAEIAGVVIAVRLLLWDQRNTTSKIAWVAVVFVLPTFGVVLYLFFGRNPQNRIFSSNQIKEKEKLIEAIHNLPIHQSEKELPELSKSLYALTDIRPMNGNKVKILTNGSETFPAILAALREAKDHIHMQYYIYRQDEISTEIRDILIEKAKAGVTVRFMFDGMGSAHLKDEFLEPLKKAGASVYAYDPVRSIWIARTANLRNHRKMIVIDGKIGFTGGLNVGEEYRSNTPDFEIWRDTHMQIEGTGVIELQESFLFDWVYMENYDGSADEFISEAGIARYLNAQPATDADDWIQIVYGGPYDKEKWVRDAMLDLMSSAKKSVWIASPYFVPDEESLAVIRRISMSGIDVRVIVPGKGDRGVSFNGSNAYIQTMIDAGAKMYSYRDDSFIHAKVMLVDGERAAVGTANFDIRSFRLNHELMVFLYDRSEAVVQIERDFNADFLESHLFTEADMKAKSRTQRMKETLASLLSPIL